MRLHILWLKKEMRKKAVYPGKSYDSVFRFLRNYFASLQMEQKKTSIFFKYRTLFNFCKMLHFKL